MMGSAAVSGILGLLVVSAVFFLQISDHPDEAEAYRGAIAALGKDGRSVKVSRTLRSNQEDHIRLVFPNKRQDQGELELYNVALTSSVEESFIYIPDLNLWVEIGLKNKRSSAILDDIFLEGIISQYKYFVIYHVHIGKSLGVENILPSYKDLLTLVLINSGRIFDPEFNVIHRIVTDSGIIEYGLENEEKIKKLVMAYRKSGLVGFEAQNLAYEYTRPKYRISYHSEVARCNEYAGTVQEKLIRCSPIRTEAFRVTFEPRTVSSQPEGS